MPNNGPKLRKCVNMCVPRGEAVPRDAAASLLPSGSAGLVAKPVRLSVLANAAPETVAHGQSGPPAVYLLWTAST